MNDILYDSPDEITNVELSISAASGHNNPIIYANKNNQLDIKIMAKATKEIDGEEVILNFSEKTWREILSLRFADSDKSLLLNGNNGWCYSHNKNIYCRELPSANLLTCLQDEEINNNKNNSGFFIVNYYLYTNVINTIRVAVSLDTANGKHFTTADIASGAERMAVIVKAIDPIYYNNGDNLKIRYGGWSTNINDLWCCNQQNSASWSYSHYTGKIKHRNISIITENGYKILTKEIGRPLFQNLDQRIWYHKSILPHALLLTSQNNGCFLNSWFIEPKEKTIGYATGLNANYNNMNNSGWPSLYFTGWPSGDYLLGHWAYWPRIKNDDQRPWHKSSSYENQISLVCYQLHVPNSSEIYWGKHVRPPSLVSNPVSIYLIDNYGNSGKLNIGFSEDVEGSIILQ